MPFVQPKSSRRFLPKCRKPYAFIRDSRGYLISGLFLGSFLVLTILFAFSSVGCAIFKVQAGKTSSKLEQVGQTSLFSTRVDIQYRASAVENVVIFVTLCNHLLSFLLYFVA